MYLPGSGGVSQFYHLKFLTGIEAMNKLCHFSLSHDCNDEVIKALAANCNHCLKILEVECSALVTDESIFSIVLCKKLVKLNIFHTGLSLPGKARILINLSNLKVLVRGDFLCDTLDYINNTISDIDNLPKLKLEEVI